MAAQPMSVHVMTPTASRAIQELTHRPDTISVWFVACVPSSVKPGRKPFSWLVVQPASVIAVAIPSGMAAQRRRRVTRTVHLSGS